MWHIGAVEKTRLCLRVLKALCNFNSGGSTGLVLSTCWILLYKLFTKNISTQMKAWWHGREPCLHNSSGFETELGLFFILSFTSSPYVHVPHGFPLVLAHLSMLIGELASQKESSGSNFWPTVAFFFLVCLFSPCLCFHL